MLNDRFAYTWDMIMYNITLDNKLAPGLLDLVGNNTIQLNVLQF